MTMDEASKLVTELQKKLSELDHKVLQYRRDMASEFNKYADDVLRNVPKDISETVSKTIAESMTGYTSLCVDGLPSFDSRETGTSLGHGAEDGGRQDYSNSKTTMPLIRKEQEDDSPRDSHERDEDFEGFFTPSYLPLLDSTTRNERRASYDPQLSPTLVPKVIERAMEVQNVDASTDTRSLQPSPELRRPPTPARKNTDEWSVTSDVSDGNARRSALRRSSSISKGLSPRRVRFDVEGEEVLPTVSPLPSQSKLSDALLSNSFEDMSDDEAGLEQVEDIDDVPPKRISSSQALRALSRGPLEDDGTQWTTVSAPPDGSASVPAAAGISQASSEEDLYFKAKPSAKVVAIPVKVNNFIPASSTESSILDHPHEARTPSDDDMLDMPPLSSMRGKKSAATILSPVKPPEEETGSLSNTATRSPSKAFLDLGQFISQPSRENEDFKFLEDEHDEVFTFDENETSNQRSPPEEDNLDSESDGTVSPVTGREPVSFSDLSKSPARDIPKSSLPKQSLAPSRGVVGSYKGRPFSMPIVSDEIHAHAASLGPMNSFVGSVNGRSGVDESDVQSFRASGGIGSFSGTPKSMSERMMMEDLLEAEEANKDGKGI